MDYKQMFQGIETEASRGINRHADEARAIANKAEKEGRQVTKAERRKVDEHLDAIKALKVERQEEERQYVAQREEDDELSAQIDKLRHGGSSNGPERGLARTVLEAGFDLRTQPRVEIPSRAIFNASTLPGEETWRVAPPGIAPLGQDRRFLYTNLPSENVEGTSGISDFKQTARTLTGTPVRDLDATTDKASLDVTLTAVTVPLKQGAVTINDIRTRSSRASRACARS